MHLKSRHCLVLALCAAFTACATYGAEVIDTDDDSATVRYSVPPLQTQVDFEAVQEKADAACALHDRKAVIVSDEGLCVGDAGATYKPDVFCRDFQFAFACVEATGPPED